MAHRRSSVAGLGTVAAVGAVLGALAALLLTAAPVAAAELAVRVTTAGGEPVAGAVVTLTGPALTPMTLAEPLVVDQVDETFQPMVTVVLKGGKVTFRNSDLTRHHVYSFSHARPFELIVPPESSSEPVALDQSGVVALGCNIHDNMIGWIIVTDGGPGLVTGPDGVARFPGLPDGPLTATVWHPRLRPGQPPPVLDLAMAGADRVESVSLPLLPARRQDRERSGY
ncbi:MAG: hypothetical protein RLY86_3368 [Pseudomonadota bacterium]|jgi:plastocyanin